MAVDPAHAPAIQAIATKANSYTLAQSIEHDVHAVQQALIALKDWAEKELGLVKSPLAPTTPPPVVSTSIIPSSTAPSAVTPTTSVGAASSVKASIKNGKTSS